MKSLNFKWYDIVILSILGLALISAFIPFNPKTSEEGVTTFYSLLTFTATMFPNNGWKYLFLFILFVLFILGTAILFIFKQKIFSKITLMGAAVAIMFYAEKNSPVNIYSTVMMNTAGMITVSSTSKVVAMQKLSTSIKRANQTSIEPSRETLY